jgi:3-methyladenine DNA glycosylase AlkD
MSASAAVIRQAVVALGDPERAASSAWFFKTGPGEYGEGDVFAGVPVPQLRKLARGFRGAGIATCSALVADELHEVRLLALFLMVQGFADRAQNSADRARWVQCYRDAIAAGHVNNWDLVDSSARQILGQWCLHKGDHTELVAYARRESLWDRRVGIIGTHAYLWVGDPTATLAVAPLIVDDRRDLIQKAFGWMLREMGKRVSRESLTGYLDEHAAQMGRTALSYAVEHLDPVERKRYRSLR